ncbi:Kinesin light chain 1-like protein [Cladobotryum mycophilum]|uniref:Kinesin light chain 1-like protein n=1 Tax=Cladobotryum mycophilum TaxID=491253 RepID=A0ABR0SAK3_9HYPO
MSGISFHGVMTGHNIVPGQQATDGGTINNYFNEPSLNAQALRRAPNMMIPFQRDENFIERAEIMAWIHSKCSWPGSRVALVGLGGVGKSQLAIQYAYEVKRDAPETWVFWVHANSLERFEEGYRLIAETLHLPWQNVPRMRVLQMVFEWLRDERNGKWMVILDGADIPDLFEYRSNNGGIMHLLPQSTNGSFLITSRNRTVAKRLIGMDRNIYEVGVMAEYDALQFLHVKLEHPPLEGEAHDLAQALGYIPLAMVQASSYINHAKPRLSISSYLEKLNKDDETKAWLLSKDFDDLRRDPNASNSAADLLSATSFFSSQGIPGYLLRASNGEDPEATECDFDKDLEVLKAYSLVSTTNDDDRFGMHPLVQFCTRQWLKKAGKFQHWKSQFILSLSHKYPKPNLDNESQCEELEPHIQPIIQEQPDSEDAGSWVTVAFKIGLYRHIRGDYKEGERLLRNAAAIFETLKVHDKDEELPRLECLHSLSSVLLMREKLVDAEEISRQVLERRTVLLGEEHRDTISSQELFACLLAMKGDYRVSQRMYRDILQRTEKLSSRNSDEAAKVIRNYANSLYFEGKYQEAEPMYREALKISEQVNGMKHATTVIHLQSFAICLAERGKYEDAEQTFLKALTLNKEVCRNRLAGVALSSSYGAFISKRGRHEEAESIFRECLTINEELLGKEDAATASAHYHLACSFMNQWRYEEAEMAFQEIVRLHGKEYPKAAGALQHLALCLDAQWRNKEAAEVLREVLSIQEAVFGKEHSETVDSLAYLAYNLLVQHRYTEAEGIYGTALCMKEKLLGKRNHSTLHTAGNLALANAYAGRVGEASALLQRVIISLTDTVGATHQCTFYYAEWYNRFSVGDVANRLGPKHGPYMNCGLCWEAAREGGRMAEAMEQDVVKGIAEL